VPVYDGVYAHEGRPARVRGVEMCKVLAVRVRPPGAHEDGLDRGCVVQVVGEGGLHGLRILKQLQRVCLDRDFDKVLDLLERVRRLDVDAFDSGLGVGVWAGGGEAFAVESAEIQDEEDETVLAAVVGEG
jgi:hypothetical protein